MKTMARLVAVAGGLALAVLVFGSQATQAELTGAPREEFIKGSFGACTDAATRDHPEIAASAVKTYCQCMAEKEADMTTQADIDYINANKAGSDDYKARIQALAPVCQEKAGLK